MGSRVISWPMGREEDGGTRGYTIMPAHSGFPAEQQTSVRIADDSPLPQLASPFCSTCHARNENG